MKINVLNVNGWNKSNHNLREELIKFGNPDVMCVTETHLKNDETLSIDGFDFYGSNRKTEQSPLKGSGGIGIFTRKTLSNVFAIKKSFTFQDYVMGITLSHKCDLENYLMLYVVYLPPQNSRYSELNETALNHLIIDIYRNSNAENIIICGDFNARIGDKDDCPDTEGIIKRHVIDNISNSQGEKLLILVNGIKGCIVNGRVQPAFDGFTSVTSHRGTAVVDYVLT